MLSDDFKVRRMKYKTQRAITEVRERHGKKDAEIYARGLMEGVIEDITSIYGRAEAFEILWREADRVIEPELEK
jgi:hypothetical protein